MLVSSTWRRDSTTLLRLRSSFDDLEFEGLAFVRRGVLDRAQVDQRTGQERADAVGHDGQAPLTLPVIVPVTSSLFLEGLLQLQPGRQTLGAVARQDGVAVAVLQRIDRHRDEVAGLNFEFALVIEELFQGNQRFGLQAGVDDHEIVIDAHDFGI